MNRSKMRSPWVSFAARLLMSGLLLGLVLRSVEPITFWDTIRQTDPKLMAVAIGMFFPTQMLAAYRWQFVLQKMGRSLPLWSVAHHHMLGQFSAFFLPGQISGDIVRTVSIAGGHGGKLTFALSVLVNKSALLAAMILIALLGTIASEPLSQISSLYWIAIPLLVASVSATVLLSLHRPMYNRGRISRLSDRLPARFRRWIAQIRQSLNVPRIAPRTVLSILLLGLALQLVNTIGSFAFAKSMHINIGIIDWAAISALASVAQIFPVSIGGLGVRESVFASALALYGVPIAQATAYSLTSFLIVVILTALGWFALSSISIQAEGNQSPPDKNRKL